MEEMNSENTSISANSPNDIANQLINPNQMIQVFVDSGAGFLSFTNKIKIVTLLVPSGTTYIQSVSIAGIPTEQVGFLSVNGEKKGKEGMVSDQDAIRPLPYIISG